MPTANSARTAGSPAHASAVIGPCERCARHDGGTRDTGPAVPARNGDASTADCGGQWNMQMCPLRVPHRKYCSVLGGLGTVIKYRGKGRHG
jgi:hypothetical protein